ncbi:NAD(P)(+) transhydrogenase (Re/Si-specific) subunit beta [Putridiphycobacter roseus]|uniref:proton-translocating NAD(P)(+) transhydrogenase n=1 Tax=Putridiphycobacter roseus TaxID=2219161 RepID=A0A2W1N4K1_9FLAO|nr:NAD(P)(+) transhydrogenase (Re/Si-specific) subunit beta [Putridiphycobacter roseus]PZE18744.1 NAD(P)(+) transhydrogenase (Re/Si-specific) subunit beta [Putridiphycobacter roseus]
MILTGNIGIFAATASFLMGMMIMGNPKKAVFGNFLLVVGMIVAIVSTILIQSSIENGMQWNNLLLIFGLLIVGTVIGKKISFGFQLTKMPELVSLFNGFGGLAAGLIGLVGTLNFSLVSDALSSAILLVSVFLGFLTFSASFIAFLKLGGKFKKYIPHNGTYSVVSLVISVLLIFVLLFYPNINTYMLLVGLLITFSLIHGVFFANGVGGGDMPILISILNGLTGVLTVISGIYFESAIMILSGVFVGATGIILTVQMCGAMNTSILKVFLGPTAKAVSSDEATNYEVLRETSPVKVAADLTLVKKVVIVPGFGLAVAKAQKLCRELKDELNAMDIELKFVIHPVAGRMPGHMNVLLAEAGIEYADILDLDKGNDYLSETDLCLVIGANDVVNTAAENDSDSSIHGMPIVQTYKSKKVVIVKRSLSPGYAGIKNPLFEHATAEMLFVDAKEAIDRILTELKM